MVVREWTRAGQEREKDASGFRRETSRLDCYREGLTALLGHGHVLDRTRKVSNVRQGDAPLEGGRPKVNCDDDGRSEGVSLERAGARERQGRSRDRGDSMGRERPRPPRQSRHSRRRTSAGRRYSTGLRSRGVVPELLELGREGRHRGALGKSALLFSPVSFAFVLRARGRVAWTLGQKWAFAFFRKYLEVLLPPKFPSKDFQFLLRRGERKFAVRQFLRTGTYLEVRLLWTPDSTPLHYGMYSGGNSRHKNQLMHYFSDTHFFFLAPSLTPPRPVRHCENHFP